MRLEIDESTSEVKVILSRRNLLTLLAKLDGFPTGSACAIRGGSDAPGLLVKAEEDDEHYGNRGFPAGIMHPDTEEKILKG